ncbi:MAG TPA: hypothetical protein VGG37_08490 [Opitutaceae bacterium]
MEFSRKLAAGAALALAGLCGISAARSSARSGFDAARRQAVDAESRLRSEGERLSGFSRGRLDAARSTALRLRESLVPFPGWERLTQAAGLGWTLERGRTDSGGDLDTRFCILRLGPANLRAWPEILSAISRVEAVPGTGVSSLDIRTEGEASARRFAEVCLTIAVRSRGEPAR